MAQLSTSPSSSDASTNSIDIHDYLFCSVHGHEVCKECSADFREDNDFTAGVDFKERPGLEIEFVINAKSSNPECKRHHSSSCGQCFGFKKQITKLNREAGKKAKGKKVDPPNF